MLDIEFVTRVLVPIFTILASGVVASSVTVRLNASIQRRDMLRAKMEDAYSAAGTYCTILTTHYMKYIQVFRGELDINQANQLTIDAAKDEDGAAFARLEMLVQIYVPEATDALGRIVAHRDRLGSLVSEHRRRYIHGEPTTPDLIPKLGKLIRDLDGLEADLKATIVRAVRRL